MDLEQLIKHLQFHVAIRALQMCFYWQHDTLWFAGKCCVEKIVWRTWGSQLNLSAYDAEYHGVLAYLFNVKISIVRLCRLHSGFYQDILSWPDI